MTPKRNYAPLETEPVSVHAPYITYPGGVYRHEGVGERLGALRTALSGVELGAYDRQVVSALGWWEIPTVATVVSLLYRVRQVGARQTDPREGGGLDG